MIAFWLMTGDGGHSRGRKILQYFKSAGDQMIRLTESTRTRLMLTHGYAMLALGLALFYVRATMTNLFFYVFGGALALLLVAGSLLFIAAVDWICVAGLGCRQVSRLRGLLIVSTGAAVCSVLLILYPGENVQMVCDVIAVYALLLSAGKFSLAKRWSGSQRERVTMYFLAVVTLGFSAALVGFAGNDDRDSLVVLATYSLFMGFQMLLTMYFLERQAGKMAGSASKLNQARV
jgi:hypothetical protein